MLHHKFSLFIYKRTNFWLPKTFWKAFTKSRVMNDSYLNIIWIAAKFNHRKFSATQMPELTFSWTNDVTQRNTNWKLNTVLKQRRLFPLFVLLFPAFKKQRCRRPLVSFNMRRSMAYGFCTKTDLWMFLMVYRVYFELTKKRTHVCFV